MKQMLRQAEREVMREAVQRATDQQTSQLSRRERCRVSREFLERLLCGPRDVGFDCTAIGGMKATRPKPPPAPFPVDEYSLLLGGDDEDEEEEKGGEVPSLVEICCLKMAEDFMVYGLLEEVEDGGLPTPPEIESESSSSSTGDDGSDDDDDEEEVSLREVMSLLPVSVLERLAWLASRERTITDHNLSFLCHPNIKRLVLIGDYTDEGLTR